MRPCDHPDGPPQPEKCRVCYLFVTDEKYRKLWSGLLETRKVAVPVVLFGGKFRNPRACPHLGKKIGGQPCGGDLHTCALDSTVCATMHTCDKWSAGDLRQPIRSCQECPYHPAASKNIDSFDKTDNVQPTA